MSDSLKSFIKIDSFSCYCITTTKKKPSNKYFSVRKTLKHIFRFRVYVELWRLEINNITRIVKYEYYRVQTETFIA